MIGPSRRERMDRAIALKRSRDLGEAVRLLEGLIAEDGEDAYALAHLAHAMLLKRRPADALDLATSALADNLNDPFARSVRGDALYRLHRYEEAAADLDAALAGDYRSAYLFSRLAEARGRSGDAHGARQALDRGLAAFPGDGKLLLALGRLERKAGDPAAAGHIEEAARALPDDPFAYKEMIASRARARAGGAEEAAAEIRQLLRIPTQAKNPHLHGELARLLTEKKDHEGALAAAERAHRLAPTNRLFRQRFAYALVRAKRDADAVVELEACLDDAPEEPALHNSYQAARRRLGQLDEAHAFYMRLLQRHPEAKKVFGHLRRVARIAGEQADADT